MPSQKSTNPRREPKRQRGHERVAALLDAAAESFVTHGYDAATMTEIAARAGASIGSLYQFFPTKLALAAALTDRYSEALQDDLQSLIQRHGMAGDAQLALQLARLLPAVRRRYPAFTVLAESPVTAVNGSAIRKQLREHLRTLLAQRYPHLDDIQRQAAAVVILLLMKATVAVSHDPDLSPRKPALAQLQQTLTLYLASLAQATPTTAAADG